MKNKCLNLELRDYFKKAMSLATAVMFTFVGAHATVAKSEEDVECGKVVYETEYNVRPEYEEVFKDIVNNEYNGIMTLGAFSAGYTTLNEILRVNERRASVRIANNEKVSINDFVDYSETCEDEVDRREIHKNIEGNINLYNHIYTDGKLSSIQAFLDILSVNMEAMGSKLALLTPGGMWLNNNAGYAQDKECFTLYVEYLLALEKKMLEIRKAAVKRKDSAKVAEIDAVLEFYGKGKFTENWWKYFDINEYNKSNRFVPIGNIEDLRDALNNSECLPEIKALIDLYFEITERIKKANVMNPLLLPNECNDNIGSIAVYDGETIYVIPAHKSARRA